MMGYSNGWNLTRHHAITQRSHWTTDQPGDRKLTALIPVHNDKRRSWRSCVSNIVGIITTVFMYNSRQELQQLSDENQQWKELLLILKVKQHVNPFLFLCLEIWSLHLTHPNTHTHTQYLTLALALAHIAAVSCHWRPQGSASWSLTGELTCIYLFIIC